MRGDGADVRLWPGAPPEATERRPFEQTGRRRAHQHDQQPGKQTGFHPLPGDVTHVPYGDAQALAAAVTEETALVIIEPVQGEKGVVVPPADVHAADLVIGRLEAGVDGVEWGGA